MEELGVKAGDSVSYFARATDNDAVNGAKQTSSDIYFLRIRPFDKNFKPAASMSGGGGGGGGGGQEVGALSQQQRQIISGTFNIQRDRKTMTAAKFREGVVVLTLAQSKLRDQVNGLVERMNSRLVVSDPSFKKIAELLPKAAEQMTAAEKKLQAQSVDGALPPENLALQFLQQAEEEFEMQVQTGRQAGGGGGGGGAGSIANDLADLFKMEMDKMANQDETNSQASTQQQDQQIDELAEKLKELARRQEQEIERQRRLASGQSAGSAGGDLQRALAEQAGRSGAPTGETVARSEPPGSGGYRAAITQRRRRDEARGREGRSVGRRSGRGRGRSSAGSAASVDAQPDGARRARRQGCAAPGRGDRAGAGRHRAGMRRGCRKPVPIGCRRRKCWDSARTRSRARWPSSRSSSIAWSANRPAIRATPRAS